MSRMRSTTLSPFHARSSAAAASAATKDAMSLRLAKLVLQELQHRDLVAAQCGAAPLPCALARGNLLRERHGAAGQVRLDQRGVHVVLAADRARVAEAVGNEIDR